jgi:hypothetical protein
MAIDSLAPRPYAAPAFLAAPPPPPPPPPPPLPPVAPPRMDTYMPVVPTKSQRGNFFQDFWQIGAQRVRDYLNLVHDMVQVLLHPAQAFNSIASLLTSGLGNGAGSGSFLEVLRNMMGLISLILTGFVEARVTPYITAAKEGDWSKFFALVSVDVVDYVTFAAVFRAFGLAKDAAKTGKGLREGFSQVAGNMVPTPGEMLGYAKYWSVGNAIFTTVVKNMGTIPREQAYTTYKTLKQDGLTMDTEAYGLFARVDFTDIDRMTVFRRAVAMNQVNYVSGPSGTWQPGREQSALKGSAQPVTMQRAEIDYLRFLPESRYQTLQKLCDLNAGYAFFQHAFATIPDAHRGDFAILMDDLYAYNQFMTSINPGYQLKLDPSQDAILKETADARELAIAAYKASFPAASDAAARAAVLDFWRSAMPVGERALAGRSA